MTPDTGAFHSTRSRRLRVRLHTPTGQHAGACAACSRQHCSAVLGSGALRSRAAFCIAACATRLLTPPACARLHARPPHSWQELDTCNSQLFRDGQNQDPVKMVAMRANEFDLDRARDRPGGPRRRRSGCRSASPARALRSTASSAVEAPPAWRTSLPCGVRTRAAKLRACTGLGMTCADVRASWVWCGTGVRYL